MITIVLVRIHNINVIRFVYDWKFYSHNYVQSLLQVSYTVEWKQNEEFLLVVLNHDKETRKLRVVVVNEPRPCELYLHIEFVEPVYFP